MIIKTENCIVKGCITYGPNQTLIPGRVNVHDNGELGVTCKHKDINNIYYGIFYSRKKDLPPIKKAKKNTHKRLLSKFLGRRIETCVHLTKELRYVYVPQIKNSQNPPYMKITRNNCNNCNAVLAENKQVFYNRIVAGQEIPFGVWYNSAGKVAE